MCTQDDRFYEMNKGKQKEQPKIVTKESDRKKDKK